MERKKVGISTGVLQKYYGDVRAIEIAHEIGADSIDFGLHDEDYRKADSIYSKSEEEIIEYYTMLKKRADELNVIINQTHGRVPGFKNIKEEDRALIRNANIDSMATKILGADTCVVHNTTSIFMGKNPDRKLMHDLSFDMFSQILDGAKKYNIKIATETFGDAVKHDACDFFGQINEFLMAYNRIKAVEEYKDYFTICVDTGHSNKASRYGQPLPGDVIRMLGSDITCLHLNDNDKLYDQHKIPKTGTIDWDDVLDALDEVGYKGIYNMELDLRYFGENFIVESAAFAVKVMRNILYERYGA